MSNDAPSPLLEVRIFGSHARGDAHDGSDIDVLCILKSSHDFEESSIDSLLRGTKIECKDISVYGEDRIRSMFLDGHLFSWHLHLESKILWECPSGSLIDRLGKPRPYKNVERDISEFRLLARDTIISLDMDEANIIHDSGILYVCLRNSAMLASTLLSKAPLFSPLSPFELAVPELSFPLKREDYLLLMAARHTSSRGLPPPILKWQWAKNMSEFSYEWITKVSQWIKEKKDGATLL